MKRFCFNLLELCLFLIFLTLISSVLSLSIPKLISLQKKRSERRAFESLMQVASDWVLFTEVDLHLRFSFLDDKLQIEIFSDAQDLLLPFPQKTLFSTFTSFQCTPTNPADESKQIKSSKYSQALELGLSDNGGLQPPLYLELKQNNAEPLTYYFPGFPHVLQTK